MSYDSGIEPRLKRLYSTSTLKHPERSPTYWKLHRTELIDDVTASTRARSWTKEFNHATRRMMERHPLDYDWADLVRSAVLDKLRANPERLSFEERYYVQTGERYVPSEYPEARYAEEQARLERFFDPEFWTLVLAHMLRSA